VNEPDLRDAPRPSTRRKLHEKRGGIFKNIRPSYQILIIIALLSTGLFVTNPIYQQTLGIIAPGILTTAIATLSAYVGAAVLGLVLATLLLLKLGRRTIPIFLILTGILALASGWFFMQPRLQYSVVGSDEGTIAIVRGTSERAISTARGAGTSQRPHRLNPTVEAALESVREGRAGAALVPTAQRPDDLPETEQIAILTDAARRGGLLTGVLAFLLALLTFGAWTSREHPLAVLAELYVDLMRGIPMLVILIYVGYVIAPAVRDATAGIVNMTTLMRGIIGLTLGYAAYMAEIFRAGIEAIPRGQSEAARSLGLNWAQTMRFVVLPQAIRIVIPPLGNEFIALLKDSSLLTILAVTEITQLARQWDASRFYTFQTWNTAALLYITLTLAATSVLDRLERRTQWSNR
jgi:polar amino acid transport system permease protein